MQKRFFKCVAREDKLFVNPVGSSNMISVSVNDETVLLGYHDAMELAQTLLGLVVEGSAKEKLSIYRQVGYYSDDELVG